MGRRWTTFSSGASPKALAIECSLPHSMGNIVVSAYRREPTRSHTRDFPGYSKSAATRRCNPTSCGGWASSCYGHERLWAIRPQRFAAPPYAPLAAAKAQQPSNKNRDCCRNGTDGCRGFGDGSEKPSPARILSCARGLRCDARGYEGFRARIACARGRASAFVVTAFRPVIETGIFLCAYKGKPSLLSRFHVNHQRSFINLFSKPSPELSLNHRKPSKESKIELRSFRRSLADLLKPVQFPTGQQIDRENRDAGANP